MQTDIEVDDLIGKIVQTPFDPGGPVEIVEIEPRLYHGRRTARVLYIEDHPHGYKAGSIGRYFLDELITGKKRQ